jgi:hypothetical protein
MIDPKLESKSAADICLIRNHFLSVPENDGSDLVILSRDNHSIIPEVLRGSHDEKVSGSFSDTIKALLPENVFPSDPKATDMAMSQRHPSSISQFLRLSVYLISNNFLDRVQVSVRKFING